MGWPRKANFDATRKNFSQICTLCAEFVDSGVMFMQERRHIQMI